MNRQLAAYWVACAELFQSPRVYFWTFTFRETQPVWRASQAWSCFYRELIRFTGPFKGVRVAEMHKDHGLHFHVLCNVRIPVAVVRRIGERWGFGRVDVQPVRNRDAAAAYLTKYLAKGEKLPCKGMKRFTRLGGLGEPVKNFECQSELAKLTRRDLAMVEAGKGRKLTRSERCRVNLRVRDAYYKEDYSLASPSIVLSARDVADIGNNNSRFAEFALSTAPEITLRNSDDFMAPDRRRIIRATARNLNRENSHSFGKLQDYLRGKQDNPF